VTASDGRGPRRRSGLLADLFVYAPIGLASEALETFPHLVSKGREQVKLVRLVGHVAVEKGQQKVGHVIDQVLSPGGSPSPDTDAAPDLAMPDVVDDESAEAIVSDDDVEQPIVVRHLRSAYDLSEAALLAIPDYDSLAASQVIPRLAGLTPPELEAVRQYEAAHRARRTILGRVAQLQQSA
jgi:hypothetical protein